MTGFQISEATLLLEGTLGQLQTEQGDNGGTVRTETACISFPPNLDVLGTDVRLENANREPVKDLGTRPKCYKLLEGTLGQL